MKDKLEVSIEAKNGRPMRSYSHDGKTFVESHENSVYQIRVKNKTDARIKAVISVDSLNIVNGKPATNDPAETGYLIGANEEQIFKGFRVDDNTVAEFTFVKREKSYATEKGAGQGNGVVSVRIYEEKENEAEKQLKKLKQRVKDLENRPREKEYIPFTPWHPYWERPYHCYDNMWHSTCNNQPIGGAVFTSNQVKCSSPVLQNASLTATTSLGGHAQAFACSAAMVPEAVNENPFSMGSGWGDAVKDVITMVEFEVGKLLGEMTIYYAALDGLKALGVNVDRIKQVVFPEPFKREFCSKPSGWKG